MKDASNLDAIVRGLEDSAFVPQYKELLYTTPVAIAEDAVETAGIDLTASDF